VPGARRRPVQGDPRRQRLGRHRPDRHLHRDRHPARSRAPELEADIIVTATGLDLLSARRHGARVDGREVDLAETTSYKGMMLSGVPNMALTFGYTNASWTLKCDLVCEYVCRLLNHMDAHGYAQCMPQVLTVLCVTLLFAAPSGASAYTVGEPSKETIEGTKRQAEHAAQEQKEENERAAKSAEEKKAAEERQQHEAVENQQQQAKEAAKKKAEEEALQCVVPSLKGDPLARATTALRRAHCKLGKVSAPRGKKSALVVLSQKLKPGAKLASGTAVGVTLGHAKHAHH
jgi:hypothetical protein